MRTPTAVEIEFMTGMEYKRSKTGYAAPPTAKDCG